MLEISQRGWDIVPMLLLQEYEGLKMSCSNVGRCAILHASAVGIAVQVIISQTNIHAQRGTICFLMLQRLVRCKCWLTLRSQEPNAGINRGDAVGGASG